MEYNSNFNDCAWQYDPPNTVHRYVAPGALGDATGVDAANAMSLSGFKAYQRSITAPHRFHFAAGSYNIPYKGTIDLVSDVTPSPFMRIEGAGDSTEFVGNYVSGGPRHSYNYTIFHIHRPTMVIQNLKVRNADDPFFSWGVDRFRLMNVTIDTAARPIHLPKDVTASNNTWIMSSITVRNYHSFGIRMGGAATSNLRIVNSNFDAGTVPHDCWIGGIQLFGPMANIEITNGSVKNNIGNCAAGTYQQGDGVEMDNASFPEDASGHPRDVMITGLAVENNGDGGLDLKASNVRVENVSLLNSGHYHLRNWFFGAYRHKNITFGGTGGKIQIMGANTLWEEAATAPLASEVKCEPNFAHNPGARGVFLENPDLSLTTIKACP